MSRGRSNRTFAAQQVNQTLTLECDVAVGIEDIAADEIKRIPSADRVGFRDGVVTFDLPAAEAAAAMNLRTVEGAWLLVRSDSRKPSALAGDPRFLAALKVVAGSGTAFVFSAPGIQSAAMISVRNAIAATTGWRERRDGRLIRIRRRAPAVGWDALIALAPRPLSSRPWRVETIPGALNAALAAAIVRLTRPAPGDNFLNLACGSATIAIERLLAANANWVLGADVSTDAIEVARRNADAAGLGNRVGFVVADGRRMPVASRRFNVICADLPWGYLVGSHDENETVYRDLLVEMARVAERRARSVLLTAELRLMQRALGELASLWRLDRLTRVEQGGARPGMFVLRRS